MGLLSQKKAPDLETSLIVGDLLSGTVNKLKERVTLVTLFYLSHHKRECFFREAKIRLVNLMLQFQCDFLDKYLYQRLHKALLQVKD